VSLLRFRALHPLNELRSSLLGKNFGNFEINLKSTNVAQKLF
jgi:hypothetical protein